MRSWIAGSERSVVLRGSNETFNIVHVAVESQKPIRIAVRPTGEDQNVMPLGAFDGLENKLPDPGDSQPVS